MLRILIVDDERPIREWIAMCLKKIDLPIELVGSAANGKEAYDIFCETLPNVIITDIRMPVIDGLELMRLVKQRNETVSFIILTCHEEFSYARQALKLGTEDYLLKTEIDQEQLEKILLRLSKTRHQYIDEEKVILERQAFIYSVFNGNIIPDEELLKNLNIYVEDKDYFIAMVKMTEENSFYQEKREEKMKDYSCFYFSYEKNVLVILAWIEKNPSQREQISFLTEFANDILRLWGGSVGISRIYSEAESIPRALCEAKEQLEIGFYKREGSMNLEMTQCFQPQDEEVSRKAIEELTKQIYSLSREEIGNRFLQWLNEAEKTRTIKSNLLKEECIFLLNRIKEKYPSLKIDRDRIDQADYFYQLKAVISELMKDLCNLGDKHMTVCIRDAVRYIEENYSQNCKLETVAKHVGLNQDYLSRLFKSSTGKTFNMYLTEIRMEAAKRLLLNADATIGEVAEKVGYQNIAYFSRVFKKYTGKAPFDYKK